LLSRFFLKEATLLIGTEARAAVPIHASLKRPVTWASLAVTKIFSAVTLPINSPVTRSTAVPVHAILESLVARTSARALVPRAISTIDYTIAIAPAIVATTAVTNIKAPLILPCSNLSLIQAIPGTVDAIRGTASVGVNVPTTIIQALDDTAAVQTAVIVAKRIHVAAILGAHPTSAGFVTIISTVTVTILVGTRVIAPLSITVALCGTTRLTPPAKVFTAVVTIVRVNVPIITII